MTNFLVWKPSNSSHLDRLHESVEENSDTDRATQELDQPRCTEESEEADLYNSCGVNDTSGHGDEVECIPGIFEIRLQGGGRGRLIEMFNYQVQIDHTCGPKEEILRTHSTVNIAVNMRFRSARTSENSRGAP